MANFEVVEDLRNLDRLLKEIEEAKKLSLKVGVEEGATYDNGTPVSDVAMYLEYGWDQPVTPSQRGWFLHTHNINLKTNRLKMPARPMFAFTAQTCKGKWGKAGTALLRNFVENPFQVAFRTLNILGQMAVQDIKTTILTNGKGTFPTRSPLTLLLYGSALESHQTKGDSEKLKKRNISKKNTSDVSKALVHGTDGAPKLLNSIVYNIDKNGGNEE